MRLATTLLVLTVSATSWAGAALDDDKKPAPQPNAQPAGGAAPVGSGTDAATATNPDDLVEYGIDVRLRQVYVPKGLLQLFVDRAMDEDAASNVGFLVLDQQLGEYDVATGLKWIEFRQGKPSDAKSIIHLSDDFEAKKQVSVQ